MPINMSNVTVGDSSITVIPVLSKWIFIDANELAISAFTISFLTALVVPLTGDIVVLVDPLTAALVDPLKGDIVALVDPLIAAIVVLVDPLTGINFNPIFPNSSGLFNL